MKNNKQKKVLIISNLPIKDKNAGPAIRCLNIAKVLNEKFDCKIYARYCSKSQKEKYIFLSDGNIWTAIKQILWADVIVSQPSRFKYLFLSRLFKKKIIIDLYDPTDIENLEMYKNTEDIKSRLIFKYSNLRLKYSILIADYFICANEIQRKYWIGYIQALGKIKERAYKKDNKLTHLVGVLPYGIEKDAIKGTDNPILKISDKIKETDKVFIWAGGIWNWFDTQSLMYAMKKLKEEREDIKLLFLGCPSENYENKEKFKNFSDTIKLAKELKIINENVFFNKEWVDYDKRSEYLLNSYAGISLHYNNIETTFSFRTRILDYLWTDLPFVTSKGDYFSELNEKYNLGFSVNFEDAEDIKEKMIKLVENQTEYNQKKENIRNIKEDFLWDNTCKDIVENIDNNIILPYKKIGIIESILYFIKCFFSFIHTGLRKDF